MDIPQSDVEHNRFGGMGWEDPKSDVSRARKASGLKPELTVLRTATTYFICLRKQLAEES